MMKRLLLVVAVLAVSACASSPSYRPALSATAAGYSERQIESDRFFVTYRSPSAGDADLIRDYALLRAAEVTLERGRDWFWVDRTNFDVDSRRGYGGPSVGIGVGGGSWGGRGGVNVGVGVNIPVGGNSSGGRARAVTVEIRLGQGVKPDDANAFDARSTSANLRSRLMVGG